MFVPIQTIDRPSDKVVPDGRSVSVAEYGRHVESFDFASLFPYDPVPCEGMYHAFWDGAASQVEIRPGTTPCAPPEAPTATTTFPPYDQLHAFNSQDPPALGHFWYNPA